MSKSVWSKNNLLIIILGYAFLAAASLYFFAKPLISGIREASDQIQEKKIDEQIDRERLESLPQMEKDWSDFQSKKEFLEVILSPENELGFIESVEFIANKSGNVISLKIGDNADPKEIAKIKKANSKKDGSEKGILDEIAYTSYFPIQINLKGNYSGLVNFIHMLENSRFYVNIISLNVQKEILDDDGEKSSRSDIFSPSGEKSGEGAEKKEIIATDINAIVYIKN